MIINHVLKQIEGEVGIEQSVCRFFRKGQIHANPYLKFNTVLIQSVKPEFQIVLQELRAGNKFKELPLT